MKCSKCKTEYPKIVIKKDLRKKDKKGNYPLPRTLIDGMDEDGNLTATIF